ncbi:hypothetical protein D779_2342 [Imhoffiella purpurea]|uniref:Uncharacterized protein n=1 Tax=Imhoffiella purpurea TaxID=1249627 RepID=W9V519_9GAMM|nr:hypothetical protein D779_2342 [Imhoffiella purpurea]
MRSGSGASAEPPRLVPPGQERQPGDIASTPNAHIHCLCERDRQTGRTVAAPSSALPCGRYRLETFYVHGGRPP